jgi:hypothetical protein
MSEGLARPLHGDGESLEHRPGDRRDPHAHVPVCRSASVRARYLCFSTALDRSFSSCSGAFEYVGYTSWVNVGHFDLYAGLCLSKEQILDWTAATIPVLRADPALDPVEPDYQPRSDIDERVWRQYHAEVGALRPAPFIHHC